MIVERLREQLGLRFGLAPEALGPAVLPPAVALRMRALGLRDLPAYAARVGDRPEELQALVEEVVVPETWFFRGGVALFAHLAEHARSSARPGGPPFRALSLPCSSGEEPCSLVLALLEIGLPLASCSVIGIDLSAGRLDQARRGDYPELSFRDTSPELRGRYFTQRGGRWELAPAVRSAVRYRQGNATDAGLLAGEGPFDLIFCRNLFIYLSSAARARALDVLDGLLAPEGLLSLGHAEPLPSGEGRFRRVGPDNFFLYRRAGGPLPPGPLSQGGQATSASFSRDPTGERGASALPWRVAAKPPSVGEGAGVRGDDPLAAAQRHADAGRLPEALSLCRQHLERIGPSARAYCLLGAVCLALHDREQATDCFRKALYLQPDHPEALLHLMVLCREEGDHERAELLRRRLARAGGEP